MEWLLSVYASPPPLYATAPIQACSTSTQNQHHHRQGSAEPLPLPEPGRSKSGLVHAVARLIFSCLHARQTLCIPPSAVVWVLHVFMFACETNHVHIPKCCSVDVDWTEIAVKAMGRQARLQHCSGWIALSCSCLLVILCHFLEQNQSFDDQKSERTPKQKSKGTRDSKLAQVRSTRGSSLSTIDVDTGALYTSYKYLGVYFFPNPAPAPDEALQYLTNTTRAFFARLAPLNLTLSELTSPVNCQLIPTQCTGSW